MTDQLTTACNALDSVLGAKRDINGRLIFDAAHEKAISDALSTMKAMKEAKGVQVLIHRGFAHSRTTRADLHEDTVREKSLADKWEMDNPLPGTFGIQPTLNALIPGCSARDAQVAATVVQWIGSQVGFCFLQEALEPAGYKIIRQTKTPA